jgi:hypothetical protein
MMTPFTTFDAQTGQPVMWGDAADIAIQAGPGQVVCAGHWDAEAFVLRGGIPRARNTRSRADLVMQRLWRAVRQKRQHLLLQHVDSMSPARWQGMSEAERDRITAYRQALLDVPQTQTDPRNIVWPDPPGAKGPSDG